MRPGKPREAVCRRIVKERSGGYCEICPRLAVQQHHRRNRSQGGRWTAANILHLCVDCHVWIGANVAAAVRNGWSIQGTQQMPDEVPVRYRGALVFLVDSGDVVPWDQEAA